VKHGSDSIMMNRVQECGLILFFFAVEDFIKEENERNRLLTKNLNSPEDFLVPSRRNLMEKPYQTTKTKE